MSAPRFANGLPARLFLLARRAGQLELARLDLLGGADGRRRGLRRAWLAAASEVDAERDLAALDLLFLAELCLLAQFVYVAPGAVVALRSKALVEVRARVGGGVERLGLVPAGGECEHRHEQEPCEGSGAHEAASLASAIGQKIECALESGGRAIDVRQRVAVGQQTEVDAAVVAQDSDRQRLIARIQRDGWIDLAHGHAAQIERLLRPRHVRHHEVEHARPAYCTYRPRRDPPRSEAGRADDQRTRADLRRALALIHLFTHAREALERFAGQ